MPTRYPRRRTAVVRRRRRIDIARGFSGQSGLGTTVIRVDLLADYKAVAGLLSPPPGATVMGIKYSLQLCGATAASTANNVAWGIQIVSDEVDADDMNPGLNYQQDWLEWGAKMADYPVGVWKGANGNGDNGFRDARGRRKFNDVGEELQFAIVSSVSQTGFSFQLASSVVLALS